MGDLTWVWQQPEVLFRVLRRDGCPEVRGAVQLALRSAIGGATWLEVSAKPEMPKRSHIYSSLANGTNLAFAAASSRGLCTFASGGRGPNADHFCEATRVQRLFAMGS